MPMNVHGQEYGAIVYRITHYVDQGHTTQHSYDASEIINLEAGTISFVSAHTGKIFILSGWWDCIEA